MNISIKNKLRNCSSVLCGSDHPTLIIGSIGSSRTHDSLENEFKKALIVQSSGAHAVTDHSFYGDLDNFHKQLVNRLEILVSCIACYEFSAAQQGFVTHINKNISPIDLICTQAKRGIDLITIHASLLCEHIAILQNNNRLIPMTSKGGGIVAKHFLTQKQENPYYKQFGEILDICREYSVTLSLGTSLRPASVCDGWDSLLDSELDIMSDLVCQAKAKNVSIMVEGIGHARISSIPTYISIAKARCQDVPYRILPMATDAGLGLDHISGAIGTAVAVAAGANAVTCMTRAEHIGLPTEEDLREGIAATRIAVHCGEISKQNANLDRDKGISELRRTTGCKSDWQLAICPEIAQAELEKHGNSYSEEIQCGMCGEHCGLESSLRSVRTNQRTSGF